MNLRSVNQNLLPVLQALLRERNVSRAAEALGLSQPATSNALEQLRGILGDPLLVRSGRGMVLTRRAEELIAPVNAVCRELETIWKPTVFDPSKSRREFVIAGSDYCATLMAPRLARSLTELAPLVRLRFIDVMPGALLDDRSEIDFAIAPTEIIPPRLASSATVKPLFIDEYVVVTSLDHPLADRETIDADDIAGSLRVSYGPGPNPFDVGPLSGAAPFGDNAGPVFAMVHQFTALPLLALLSGAIAIVPRRLAEVTATCMPLRIIEGGVGIVRVDMALVWTRRHDGDPAHGWFRDLIQAYFHDDRFRDAPVGPGR